MEQLPITKGGFANTYNTHANFTELFSRLSDARTYAYLSATEETTCTLADTFYPILGTFINDPIVGFDVHEDKLRYLGPTTREFEIDWSASFNCDTVGSTIHIGVSVNDEVIDIHDKSVMGMYVKYADESVTMAGTLVVTVEENQTIELQISSDSATDIVSFDHFTTTIRKFI